MPTKNEPMPDDAIEAFNDAEGRLLAYRLNGERFWRSADHRRLSRAALVNMHVETELQSKVRAPTRDGMTRRQLEEWYETEELDSNYEDEEDEDEDDATHCM